MIHDEQPVPKPRPNSRPNQSEIDEKQLTRLRLRWNALRRHRGYKAAVHSFSESVRSHQNDLEQKQLALGSPPPIEDEAAFSAYITRWQLCHEGIRSSQDVLDAYQRFSQWLCSELTSAERQALGTVDNSGAIFTKIGRLLRPALDPRVRDRVPPLNDFSKRWCIGFPIPPDCPYVIRRLMLGAEDVPVRIEPGDWETELTVTIRLDVPKELLLVNFESIVDEYALKENPPWKRLSKWSYYDAIFRVYDLTHEGLSNKDIAMRLWPEEFNRDMRVWPQKNPILQRVTRYKKSAEKLLDAIDLERI